MRLINDEVYKRILKKIEDGTFVEGEDCGLNKYYFENMTIADFPISARTPEVCVSLMNYAKCSFDEVPESSRTREFFLESFCNKEVFNYIKENITSFDRQFFKDLIATNKYATSFDHNAFSIMPLEYIDEEMCTLAMLSSLNWSDDDWFYSVYERKPEALTQDLYKFGARLYSRLSEEENRFLDITPLEYRDQEYYREMCNCNFNCGMELTSNKGKIMNSIPKDVITGELLLQLLSDDLSNIAMFSEDALERELKYSKAGVEYKEKLWQFVVRLKGSTIKFIPLNDERIEYFLKCYDKDSFEYRLYFKDNYKKYKKQKENEYLFEKKQQEASQRTEVEVTMTLADAFSCVGRGEKASKAIENATSNVRTMGESFVPIKYQGVVPEEFSKTHDQEEYLELVYKTLGIEIVEEYDNFFYRAILPYGWSVENDGYWNNIKDNQQNTVIEYFYDSKFYDKDAYVNKVNLSEEKQKVMSKSIY